MKAGKTVCHTANNGMGKTTGQKGNIGVAQAIATFTKLGNNVFVPISEGLSYDLVIEFDGELKKVQARYTTNGVVEMRRVYSNTKGTNVHYPEEGDFDYLYVLRSDGEEFLIKDNLVGRNSIRPKDMHKINGR